MSSQSEAKPLSDDLLFGEDDCSVAVGTATQTAPHAESWKLLVIDDDEMIHRLTDAVLEDFTFKDRKLNIIHGYSGADARRLMAEHADTAVVLLDVVMESVNAGFEVVKYIRETLNNHQVRIILRTGQPGTATETEIVSEYEINDYREKSDLTSAKLHSSLIISLRAYQDMKAIQSMARSGDAIESMVHEKTKQFSSDKENIKSDFNRLIVNGVIGDQDLENLLAVINKSEFIVYIKDLQASYLMVNRCFEEFFQVNGRSIIGKRDDDFLPKPLAEQIMKSDLRVLSQSAAAQQEETIRYNDIHHLFYALKFPLYDSAGNFSAICGIAAEITDSRTMQK